MTPPKKITKALVRFLIPPRKSKSHKGDYGHVLILASSRGMSGAAVLSAWGALRGGAGLVTVGVPESQQPIVAKKIRPEAMTLALPETIDGTLSPRAIEPVMDFILKRKITALAVGPGLSKDRATVLFVKKLMQLCSKNLSTLRGVVLDADGFLAIKPESGEDLLQDLSLPWIVTPHTGELSQFTEIARKKIESHPQEILQKFATLYPAVTVLKGHHTFVAHQTRMFENQTGNPGMATGGSGDVLTGLIAALIAQVPPKENPVLAAAICGVWLHGFAGDIAARKKGQVSLLAQDIAEALPEVFKELGR